MKKFNNFGFTLIELMVVVVVVVTIILLRPDEPGQDKTRRCESNSDCSRASMCAAFVEPTFSRPAKNVPKAMIEQTTVAAIAIQPDASLGG